MYIFVSMSVAHAQKTFEECNDLWQYTSEMAKCQMIANEAKEKEIATIIKNVEAQFKVKSQIEAVLKTQNSWSKYIEFECRARMNPMASGSSNAAIYQICRHEKLKSRINELKGFHYCEANGCPERSANES